MPPTCLDGAQSFRESPCTHIVRDHFYRLIHTWDSFYITEIYPLAFEANGIDDLKTISKVDIHQHHSVRRQHNLIGSIFT